ncbi:MAG: SMC family ATPase [candidate division Zixibacteria bacterium]|nr:SMC family ATPase [candidate division Zixibacteria bacterium]
MRLCSLSVQNYRVIRGACLDLPAAVIAIVGPNGAGKSTLVEAVAWALFGNQAARSGKEEIRSQFAGARDNCEVTLEFEINREQYKVTRKLAGAGLRPEATLWRNGQVMAIGSSECETAAAKILGLDLKGFETSFLAQQNELNALATLPAAKRKDHLATMLGVDRIDRALARLKQDQKVLSMVIESLEERAGARGEIELKITAGREHIEKLQTRQSSAAGAYETAKQALDQAVITLGEHDTRKTRCSLAKAALEAEHKTQKGLAERRQALTEKIKALEATGQKVAAMNEELATLPELESRWERLQKDRVTANRRSDLERQKQLLSAELVSVRERLTGQQKEMDESKQRLSAIPEDVGLRSDEVSGKLDQAREKYAGINAELAVLTDQLKKSSAQLDDLASIGPDTVCDRCHRPFGADLPSIRGHLQNEVATLKGQLEAKQSELEGSAREGAILRKEHDSLRQAVQDRRALATLVTGQELLAAESADRARTVSEKITAIENEMSGLGEVSFDEKVWQETDKRVKELRRLAGERERCVGELSHLGEVSAERQRVNGQMIESQAQAEKIEGQIREIGFDEKAHESAQGAVTRIRELFEKARDEQVAVDKELDVARAELQKDMEYVSSLAAAAEEMQTKRDDMFYRAGLARLLGEYRTVVIGRIRPRLSELAGELMAEMTAGRYSLTALDEDYNLQLWDNGEFFGIDRFSGGEKDLASLCLRLAISEALTEAAGLAQSFVILDEVFGSQDDQRKDLVMSALTNLKDRFPQMLLITHVDDIKDRVEHLIQVAPTGKGWSEVRVNGVVA